MRRRGRRDVMAVAAVFLAAPTEWRYGLDIAGLAGLRLGAVYPALTRLESAAVVESRWEPQTPAEGARRRQYRLADDGADRLRHLK